jgi:hypothetical protein
MKDGELYDALLRPKGYHRKAGVLLKGSAAAAPAVGAVEAGAWLDGAEGLGGVPGADEAYGDGYADYDGGGCDDYCGADGDDGGGIDLDDGLLPVGEDAKGNDNEKGGEPVPDWLHLGGEGAEPMDAELQGEVAAVNGNLAAAPQGAAAAGEKAGIERGGLEAAREPVGQVADAAAAGEGAERSEAKGAKGRRGAGQRSRRGEQVTNMDGGQGYYDPYQPLDPSDKGNLPIKPLQVVVRGLVEHAGMMY